MGEDTSGISKQVFLQLLQEISDWYDQRGAISMLKVLYRDHVTNANTLHKADEMHVLLDDLHASGNLNPADLSILYDTINITEQYGFRPKNKIVFQLFQNVKTFELSKFTSHRQKLVKLGKELTEADVAKLNGVYNSPLKKYKDSWSIILDLECRKIICKEKMEEFIKTLNDYQIRQAVDIFKDDTYEHKASSSGQSSGECMNQSNNAYEEHEGSSSGQSSDGVNLILERRQTVNNVENDILKYYAERITGLESSIKRELANRLSDFFNIIGANVDSVKKKCVVFHLSFHDPDALMHLWNIHLSGKLISGLAEILIPQEHQKRFLDEWRTYIDENEYRAALSKLKQKAGDQGELLVTRDTLTGDTNTGDTEAVPITSTESKDQPRKQMETKKRNIRQKGATKKLKKTDSLEQPNKETNDEDFAELTLLVSEWYDKYIPINMLKVLYRDHVEYTFELHKSFNKTIDLINMLIRSGYLSSNDVTLLYDTIKATKQFGLEQEIIKKIPSLNISENMRDKVITNFTVHRQRLVKLGMALTLDDVRTISELYQMEHTDCWSLILELEHRTYLFKENMQEFIEKLKTLELHLAVKALTEETEGQPQMKIKKRKTGHKRPTKKLKTNLVELPNKGISEEDFGEILLSMSRWYDRHGYINMLKVLYTDLVTEPDKLYAATNPIELFELLCTSGHLSAADPTVLYDTINVTKPFGLEPEIRKLTVKTPFVNRAVTISKFTTNRQSLIKFVESLTDNDVKKISKFYRCEQKTNRWELFVDLEHRGKFCEEKIDEFMKQITTRLIIDSYSDPLGLRGTDKGNKDPIQETISRTSTADHQGEQMITGDTLTGDTDTSDTGAGPSTSTETEGQPEIKSKKRKIGQKRPMKKLKKTNLVELPNKDDLIKNYLLSTQQRLFHNANRFTPATLNTRYQVDIAHMFTNLDLLKENEKKQDVKQTTLEEVLQIIKSTPACKVLIEGEGGIGKSTLLRYIAYKWATDESDETFRGKIMFLVNISTIDKGETILDGILKQIDLEDFHLETNLCPNPVIIKRFIRNHDSDITLLLDGLDELKDGSKSPISFFKNQNMPKCKVILTSRSDKKIDEFVKESNIHVKVKGFDADNIVHYIRKHFKYFEEPVLGDMLVEELKLSRYTYKHEDVKSMCKNPMLLLSVCVMWEERQYLPTDKSDLFKEIFRTILNQFIAKQTDKEQKISVFKNIPQKYVELMLMLGKCMYNGLKKNQLSINETDLEGTEEMVSLTLKLGFVYKDRQNLKSDFEKIFTAPHKLIVESLVGFYLCKLCRTTGSESECSEDMKRLLQPLDDKEWKIIRESEHLHIAREFAIGFLGAKAGMFLKHWITNSLSTYRSLMALFKFVKLEHRRTVENTLVNHMENLEIMPHISDICKSLRKFMHHVIPDLDIENEHFIHLMQRFHSKRLEFLGSDVDILQNIIFWKEMASEEKGRMIAHILVAVPNQKQILEKISEICVNDDFKCLIDECQKLGFKYDVFNLKLSNPSSAPYIIHLLNNAPRLTYLSCSNSITGAIMNDVMRECCSRGVKLGLKQLDISDNNLSNIDGSSLATLLFISPTLSNLIISNCNLSGAIVNDMMRECCSKGVKLELMELHISDNNLSNIDGSLLAFLLVIAPTLSNLKMSNCNLTGAIISDMITECCSRGVKLQLKEIDISDNNLSNIDGSSLASLLVISPTLSNLKISNCSLSGAIMSDMMRECCSKGVKFE